MVLKYTVIDSQESKESNDTRFYALRRIGFKLSVVKIKRELS